MDSSTPHLADTSRLCKVCVQLVNDVISGNPLGEDRWVIDFEPEGHIRAVVNSHYHKIGVLEQSASQGCQLCCFLRDCLSRAKSGWYTWGSGSESYHLQPGDLYNTLEVCCSDFFGSVRGTPFYFFDRYTPSEMVDAADLNYGALAWKRGFNYWNNPRKVAIARGTCPDPASSTTLSLLIRWLDDCKTRHKECKRTTLKSPLPTRVIDVGTKDCDPFLYTSLGEKADYITLSYAWGGDVVSKTTMSNVGERQKIILLTSLPQTFQDAIIIARGLKIRYIWIDALCIIQDDPQDWLRESVTMSQVYENCILTISATKSNKCESGFLQGRDTAEQELGTYLDGAERPLYVRVAQSNVHQIRGPLNDRGWTFQERFLSPAVLHFTEDGIYWECRSLCINDSGARLSCNTELKALYAVEEWSYKEKEYESASSFENFWTGIVQNYCKRSLTFPEDKLVALSGIAQRYQVRTNRRYVAGLWEDRLMHWLLWEKSKTAAWGREVFGQRPSIYRAPSWSWASLDGSFKYNRLLFKIGPVPCPNLPFRIQGYDIQEKTLGACGKISGGHLTIKALLYEAMYTMKINREMLHTEIGTWDCSMDALICSEGEEEWTGPCWVMPIAIWPDYDWGGSHYLSLWGLVLGRPQGVFQSLLGSLMRLGMAKMSLPQEGPLPNYKPSGEKYNTKGPESGRRAERSETIIDHFPGAEKRQSERSIATQVDSCFFNGMSKKDRRQWEKRMSALKFNRSKVRTVRII